MRRACAGGSSLPEGLTGQDYSVPKPWTCLPCYACPQGLGSWSVMAELLWSLGLLWQFPVSCWWDQDSCRRATGAVAPGFTKAPAISWLKHSSPRWGGSLRIQAGLGPRGSGGLGRAPGLSHSPTLPAAREDPLGGLLWKLPGGRPGHDPWPRAPLHERSWPGAPVFAGASLSAWPVG